MSDTSKQESVVFYLSLRTRKITPWFCDRRIFEQEDPSVVVPLFELKPHDFSMDFNDDASFQVLCEEYHAVLKESAYGVLN